MVYMDYEKAWKKLEKKLKRAEENLLVTTILYLMKTIEEEILEEETEKD